MSARCWCKKPRPTEVIVDEIVRSVDPDMVVITARYFLCYRCGKEMTGLPEGGS
jgi:hypothetical protein